MDNKTNNLSHKSIRLFTNNTLERHLLIKIDGEDYHYLKNVMRISSGDELFLFNGIEGEWKSKVVQITRKYIKLEILHKNREQINYNSIECFFSPLNNNRHNYIIEKLTELGILSFTPVLTSYCNIRKFNQSKAFLRGKEAAEQCGLLQVPNVNEMIKFNELLKQEFKNKILIFFDEESPLKNPIEIINSLKGKKISFLIGPEGGFSDIERASILELNNVVRLSLGSRILRADTAAIVSASIIQFTFGDI